MPVLLILGSTVVVRGQDAAPPQATLRIDVSSIGGDAPVTAPYVAVVSETSPWSEPVLEEVIESGSSVAWRLPPGRYRVVAGAPGTTVEYGPVIDLTAGRQHRARIDVTPMRAVEGRIVDEAGQPLSGATVVHLRRLVHDFSLRLSPLGEEHLRETFESESGENGRVRVHLHPEAGNYLAVEMENRAPRFFPNLRLAEAPATLRNVVLHTGGSLTVTWEAPASGVTPYDRLLLIREDRRLPSGLEPAAALAVWARPFPASGSAVWPALLPGRYEIWLKAPPRGAHDDVPLLLGQVSVTAAAHVTERIEPPTESRPVDAEGTGGAVDVLLPALSSAETETLEVRGWRRSDPAAPEELAFTVRSASGGSLVRVEAACRPATSLALTTRSRVATLALGPGACGPDRLPARAALLPRADVELQVTAPPGQAIPSFALLSVGACVPIGAPPHAAPASESPVHLEMTVPIVNESGRWTIRAPAAAGCTAVTAKIADYAALDWPDLELEAGATIDLGSHRLRTGAALLVRVVSATDGRPLDGVLVQAVDPDRALAALRGTPGGTNAEGSASPAGGIVSARGGWARLHGLPPDLDLVVLLTGGGRSRPHPAVELRLAPGEERMLDFLELPPPGSLEIRIGLSSRLEEAEAVPHEVFLRQTGAEGPPLTLSHQVGPDRTVVVEDLPGGTWRIEGIARGADGKPFPAGSREIELSDGEQRIVELDLTDSIYMGRVTYEGIPVQGSLSVTPVSPADRRGMSVLLDEEGRFRLPLEGPGIYTVRIYDERDRRFDRATLAAVEFGDPEEEVRIRVPEGRIGGVVIDSRGNGVTGATVLLQSRQNTPDDRFRTVQITARTSPAGDFLAEGLAAGAWTLTASAGELGSEPVVVAIAPDERVEAVELVLEQAETVAGIVTDGTGRPVAGAQLVVSLEPGSPREIPAYLRATTDQQGRFEVSGAGTGRMANLRVQTPSGAVHALRAGLVPDLRLRLPPESGAVELELPCAHSGAWISGNFFLVAPTGAFLPTTSLLLEDEPSSGDGCRVVRTAPGLAAGAWRLVRVTTPVDEALLLYGQGGTLESHGELVARPGAPVRVVVEAEEPRSSTHGNRSER